MGGSFERCLEMLQNCPTPRWGRWELYTPTPAPPWFWAPLGMSLEVFWELLLEPLVPWPKHSSAARESPSGRWYLWDVWELSPELTGDFLGRPRGCLCGCTRICCFSCALWPLDADWEKWIPHLHFPPRGEGVWQIVLLLNNIHCFSVQEG